MAGHAAKRASRLIQERTNDFIKSQSGPKWKRELVPDHKWDYIDVEEFRKHSCYVGLRYLLLYCAIILSALAYFADLWTAGLLLSDTWSLAEEPKIPFYISKWIFVACIILSFLLLAWDVYKCRAVLATRDISLGATNTMAYRYYSVRNYAKFCLFRKINDSRKASDTCAFFVFYTLKGWKKLLFAQGPRQIIAGVTLYAMLRSAWTAQGGGFQISSDWEVYGKNWQQRVALISMSFTCILWILSMLELLAAIILYIPVFCQIQGNLKEYCCHKIDKRIAELLEKQRRKRMRDQERRLAKKNGGSKNGKNNYNNSAKKGGDEYQDIYDENLPLRSAAAPPSLSDQYIDAKSEMAPVYHNGYPASPRRPAYQQDPYSHYPNDHQSGYFEMQSYRSPAPPSAPTPALTPQWSISTPSSYHTTPHTPMTPAQHHYSPNQAAGPAPPLPRAPYGDGGYQRNNSNSYF
ncbi:hypothetical protein BDB00DRAFT_786947 [Zychaea mexicana]|uniref:uncharacterized protein n=1 Tax=Zychaea mexicana TaxID=64656 RepID=UPI0022FF42D0|nr:uncharacterized protein BDB00DRAFT_786947 [Zychaea mexicana]KAI9494849.1 hypothetical protein BDB00DRAFT_786947 [Zychaea mexicana]